MNHETKASKMNAVYIVKEYFFSKGVLLLVEDRCAYREENDGQKFIDSIIRENEKGKYWNVKKELIEDSKHRVGNRLRSVHFKHENGCQTSFVLDVLPISR